MKKVYATSLVAVLLSACGGGGDDSPGVQVTPPASTPPPVAQTPPPASQPPAAQPPAAQPPAAQPPAAQPPAASPPASPPPASPPPAQPPAVPPPPAPPPVDTRPKLLGSDFTWMMEKVTVPTRGGPNFYTAVDDPDGTSYGTIYSYQYIGGGTYSFNSGAGPHPTGNSHPYWYFQSVTHSVPSSYQDGQMWWGPSLSVQYGQYAGDAGKTIYMRKDDGFTVNPDDQLVQNTTLAQWNATDGSPYYVQLQTGTHKGFIRNCWHYRLPGILRQTCMLWDKAGAGWRYAGDYTVDDSNERYAPMTFEAIWTW